MNKKEIRIDLLPEDFEKKCPCDFYLKVLLNAINRIFPKIKTVSVWVDSVQIGRTIYAFDKRFEYSDYKKLKSQYEKGTKTRYYITLIPQS